MKSASTILAILALISSTNAYVPPQSRSKATPPKPAFDLKKAVAATFTAATIASSTFMPIAPADAADYMAPISHDYGTTTLVSAKTTREGVYGEYSLDVPVQEVDDARSTFKTAKETKSKKGKYVAILAILVVGSLIIPMGQYFWYVRDDNSLETFLGNKKTPPPPPPPPPKKKNFFGR